MFGRVLIVNRGDCALRLLEACHAEGCEGIVASSLEDAGSLVCSRADGVIFTGQSRDAYTREDDLLEAAHRMRCEAILPGWGFLSESYTFARKCRLSGLVFLGPKTQHIQWFGDKLRTLEWFGDVTDQVTIPLARVGALDEIQARIPGALILKHRFGGGGKGVERIEDRGVFAQRLRMLEQSGLVSQYYVEPAVESCRHIEFQMFGMGAQGTRCLGVRDCTAQVFHQKFFERSVRFESGVFGELARILEDKLGAVQFEGWCTVEWLMRADGSFRHLLEINPRLQVEHGVTEMTSGLDLVRTALRSAWAHRYEAVFRDLDPYEEACEFRLYARSTGVLERLEFEGFPWPHHAFEGDCGYRLETAYAPGMRVDGVYDGMLARLIVGGVARRSREALGAWLRTLRVEGVAHNLLDFPGAD